VGNFSCTGQAGRMSGDTRAATYDAVVLPHLEVARRLARRLMRDEHDAEDAVQDASLRALAILRDIQWRRWARLVLTDCPQHLLRRPPQGSSRRRLGSFDEEKHSVAQPEPTPEALLLKTDDATSITRAMSGLPDPLHQVLVLRELEGLSYRELADVVGIPVGTVMSRLSRARVALRGALGTQPAQPGRPLRPRRVQGSSPASRPRQPMVTDSRTNAQKRPETSSRYWNRRRCSDDGSRAASPAYDKTREEVSVRFDTGSHFRSRGPAYSDCGRIRRPVARCSSA
jgi:RNA polymerase sigma-70 factor (ECF subfamily)